MKSVLAAAAVAALSVSSAVAADLAPHIVTKAPPVPTAYNWTGLYIGGHGGIGWFHGETSAASITAVDALPAHPTSEPAGVFGGGQIGFNYQFAPNWVVGVQGDWSGFSANDDRDYSGSIIGLPFTGRYSTRVDWLASATGRLGYAVNNVLFYGKGGGAWIRNRFRDESSGVLGAAPFAIFIVNDYAGASTRSGWTVGAGAEFGLTRNWSVGFEYDYYDFGSSSETLRGGTVLSIGAPGVATGNDPETLRFKQTLSVAKASLNYRF